MRILIIGLDMYGYTSSLSDAYRKIGHEVRECVMKEVGWRYSFGGRLYMKCKSTFNRLLCVDAIALSSKKNWVQESNKVLKEYDEYNPDIVISFAAYILTPEVLTKMKKSKLILWIYDSIRRLPEIHMSLPYYDRIYTYERSDIDFFNRIGYDASFLPLCVDPNIYYKLDDVIKQKEIDISFVGSMTKERVQFLRRIVKNCPDLKCKFYGKYLQPYDLFGKLKRKIFKEERYFTNKNISVEESRLLYANSKICLNLLQAQSKDGANMRLFELMNSGAFQVVTSTRYICENFSDCVVTFKNINELYETISLYLQDDRKREQYCNNGLRKVAESELFIHRAKQILDSM